ncbi:MAG: hypothetical protein ACLQLH_17405 [Terracidiphilus sp.]
MRISLLCLFLVGLVGCSNPIQRFVPVVVPAYGLGSGIDAEPELLILDTQTGRLCVGKRFGTASPICQDFYTGKIK